MPAVAGRASDIRRPLSDQGADLFLVAQDETRDILAHVLEKVYLPIPIYVDDGPQDVGAVMYQQPAVGIPFGRAFTIDVAGFVVDCAVGYSPGHVIEVVDAATP